AVRILSWTPNDVEVEVDGAEQGDHVVLNQNWDPGWRAGDTPAVNYRDAVATLAAGSARQTVRFHYWPRTFALGLALTSLTLAAIGYALRRARRLA
ncbi:MAG TPA: hypothetical protein VIF09_26945, partial [Polyangiaceae bacterium]